MVIQAVVDEGDGRSLKLQNKCHILHEVVAQHLPSVLSVQLILISINHGCVCSLQDCLGHAHVLLAAFERVRMRLNES